VKLIKSVLKWTGIVIVGFITLIFIKDLSIGTYKTLAFKWEMYKNPPTYESLMKERYGDKTAENR
jgi:hypothetical protein